MIGNTFDTKKTTYGHAKKVWRSLRHVYPGGGTITNVADFVDAKLIPAGSPVKYDPATKKITIIKDTAISGAADAAAVVDLGINAYLQEDAVITDGNTVATGTAVYAGELYEYTYTAAVLAKLKLNTLTPQIVFVQ